MRAALPLFAAFFVSLIASAPARADCTPTGSTVNCASPGTGGFDAGAANNFNVTVQPGTTVQDNGVAAIILNDNNTVINNGTITAASGSAGIVAVDNNSNITNNGIISLGDNSAGIFLDNNNVVTNTGTITGGDNTFGISVLDNNTVVNSGTIAVGGFGAIGIDVGDNNTAVTNIGRITAGTFGTGIRAFDGNVISNSGSIIIGDGGTGILLHNNNTVTNSGNITVGDGAAAIQFNRGNVFNNTGTIIAGANGYVFAPTFFSANNNTITSSGTLDGIIQLNSNVGASNANSLTNSGLITITNPNTAFAEHFLDGSFTQTASGTLALRFSPDNGFGYDILTVEANSAADTTKLAGTLRAVIQPGLYQPTQTYLSVVSFCSCFGGVIEGTFGTVSTTSPFFIATATYGSNDVDLTLTRIPFGLVPGMTLNQRAVGDALERGYSPTVTGDAATFYGNLFAATSVGVFDQLSGEGTSATQDASFTAGRLFNTAMLQQGVSWLNGTPGGDNSVTFSGPSQYATVDKRKTNKPGYEAFASVRPQAAPEPGRWRAWGAGFGATHSVNGEASPGSADQSQRTAGGAFGVDHQIGADLLLGFAAGGSGSTFSVPSRSTSGRVDGGHVGAHAIKTLGAAYVAATLNFARFDNTTDRTIAGIGPTETATGKFTSDQLSGRLEFGWKYAFDRYSITPFAAVEPAGLWQRGYSETSTVAGGGPGILGLSYQSHTATSLPMFLGAQLDARYALAGGQTLSPFARAAWVHEFKPDRRIQASFISVPAAAFTVDGARAASDTLRVDTGATLAFNRVLSLFASMNGEYSGRSRTYATIGGAKIAW